MITETKTKLDGKSLKIPEQQFNRLREYCGPRAIKLGPFVGLLIDGYLDGKERQREDANETKLKEGV
jgi:hypothetical protein